MVGTPQPTTEQPETAGASSRPSDPLHSHARNQRSTRASTAWKLNQDEVNHFVRKITGGTISMHERASRRPRTGVTTAASCALAYLAASALPSLCAAEDEVCRGSCCENGEGAIMLPVFPMEHTWNKEFRAFLYIVGLLWCFVGVSVLSDVFMAGIEAITNSTYKKKVPRLDAAGNAVKDSDGNPEFDFEDTLIWNPAVANLTLMALGSSTPEILLSIIEITGQGFYSGDLGPGTVVGSAAFNLYVITAMCMLALPEGEGRRIDNLTTFSITSFHSLFAYLWMAISLLVISPHVIELWEALVTLGAMPWLTFWVWCADNNWFRKPQVYPAEAELQPVHSDKDTGTTDTNGDEPRQPVEEEPGPVDTQGEASPAIKRTPSMREQNVAFIKHRHNALAQFIGGKSKHIQMDEAEVERLRKAREDADLQTHTPVFQFEAEHYAFLETVGKAVIKVTRGGKVDVAASVQLSTVDDSAVAGEAFQALSETVQFAAGEVERDCEVGIIHDKVWRDDKQFKVVLSVPDSAAGKVGQIGKATVTIIDMDGPGVFCWMDTGPRRFLSSDSKAHLVLERRKGCCGAVRVRVKTVGGTAQEGVHFGKLDQEMEWNDGEASKGLAVELKQFEKPAGEGEVFSFFVELESVEGKAEIGAQKRAEVNIQWNATSALEGLEVLEEASWAEQFRQALSVGGGEGVEEAGLVDLVMHYLSITWKLLAAFIPPPNYLGGWATFWVALGMIGVVTAVIGDLASIFGCLVGLKDSVTAITVVALGTSLPDTFASVLAIRADENADNAIGNVTGSNSINVFLGLGLPWTMAAIYWGSLKTVPQRWRDKYGPGGTSSHVGDLGDVYEKYKDTGAFVVPGGSLGFNTLIFTILTLFAFFMFGMRRYWVGYEIGGPRNTARLSAVAFASLWLVYILLSSLQVYHPESFLDI